MATPILSPAPPQGNRSTRTRRADPPCIDLSERYGRRYRVEYEPSYAAQYGPRARVSDPWLKTIPCRAGHVMPWGLHTLAAVTDRPGSIVRKLTALPGAVLWQDGSDGAIVLFDASLLPKVAKIMHPRRARRLSDGDRQRLLQAGADFRFRHGARARFDERQCVQTSFLDQLPDPADEAVLVASSRR